MPIIEPHSLEADAVVPQCLDNQFVTKGILQKMFDSGKSFADLSIIADRNEAVHAEFLRSLLYSSQVIVNRSYFINSHYLHKQVEESVGDVAQLIHDRAITPYLFGERSFGEIPSHFHTQDRALIEKLAGRVSQMGDASVVRLSSPPAADDDDPHADAKNAQATAGMAAQFKDFCIGLGTLDEDVANSTASQLYFDSPLGGVHNGDVPKDVLERFKANLRKVGQFSYIKSVELHDAKKRLGREHIYSEFFAMPNTDISAGIYRSELKTDESLWMLMKLIDLKYNANLPDALDRYTLTPATLPARSALPFAKNNAQVSAADTLRKFREAVIDKVPHVNLPRLKTLTLDHARQIRSLDSWYSFSAAQKDLLKAEPADLLDAFTKYQGSLNSFQRELSDWCVRYGPIKDQIEASVQKIDLTVDVIATIGGIALHLIGHELAGFAVEAGHLALANLPRKLKDVSIKLSVEAHDAVTRKLVPDHSYRLELHRLTETSSAELLEMIRDIRKNNTLSAAAHGLAEQANQ